MYKNIPLEICMEKITPQEQYEVIRIILESKTEQITICKHNSTNKYIDVLIDKLNITIKDCQKQHSLPPQFDHHKGYNLFDL